MVRLEQNRKGLWALLLLLLCVLLAMGALSKCSHRTDSPFGRLLAPSGGDTIDVAIELNPTIYSVRGDSAFGRDYEMLMRISEQCGVPIKLHPFTSLSQACDGLESGTYDVVAASMPATSGLRSRFLLTQPVYLDREVLIQPIDTALGHGRVTSQFQLAGDTVWIPGHSPIAERIANLSAEMGDTIYVMQDDAYTAEYLMMLVARGRIRMAVINERIASDMSADYPQVDLSTPVSFTQFQSWAVNRDNRQLADSLNAWLDRCFPNR